MEMILAVGGTGVVGRMAVRRLLERGERVRILVRPDSDAGDLVVAGAEPVVGDLREPRSLARACEGVAAVVATANAASPRLPGDSPETVDDAGTAALAAAAMTAGVRHLVYVSALIADPESPVPLLRAKGRAEAHLRAGGVPWTILRPDAFMESWPAMIVGMPVAAGRPVRLPLPPTRRHSFISAADVAAYATAMLGRREAMGRSFDLGGPEPLTWADVARIYADVLGRDVVVEVAGAEGDPAPLSPIAFALLAAMESFDSILNTAPIAAMFGVTPIRLEHFVRQSPTNQPEPRHTLRHLEAQQ
jgi:uncharacterized protein YbjT (DUF2867 family)